MSLSADASRFKALPQRDITAGHPYDFWPLDQSEVKHTSRTRQVTDKSYATGLAEDIRLWSRKHIGRQPWLRGIPSVPFGPGDAPCGNQDILTAGATVMLV